LRGLAQLPAPLERRQRRGSIEGFERVREQARVQFEARIRQKEVYETLPCEPGRGLARLPEPSPGDIFLDFEGDPFVGPAGLEYLFGWHTADRGDACLL